MSGRPAPPGSLSVAGVARYFPRPATLWLRAALVIVNLAAVTFFLLSFRHGIGFGPHREDLGVYRLGGRIWLHGGDLYRQPVGPGGALRLPFTYPPIAAVLLSPLSLVPRVVAVTALTLGTVALLAIALRVFLQRLAGPGAGSPWVLAWLLPAALFIEPVRNTLWLGQLNIVLMALVTLDCLAQTPRWPRGALVGLAAAIKLTPAAFVLFFLLRKDYRAAATAGASFAITTGLGFLLAWHDSVRYWTSVVFQTSRIGNLAYAGNQSIEAVVARAGLGPQTTVGTAISLTLAFLAFVAACLGMRRALAASEFCWALSLNAFAALLISPISWSHHWVWCVPALLTLAILGRRHGSRLWLAVVAAGLVVFAAAPQWWFPSGADRELRWAAWQQVVGSSYVIFGALVLVLSARARLTGSQEPIAAASDSATSALTHSDSGIY